MYSVNIVLCIIGCLQIVHGFSPLWRTFVFSSHKYTHFHELRSTEFYQNERYSLNRLEYNCESEYKYESKYRSLAMRAKKHSDDDDHSVGQRFIAPVYKPKTANQKLYCQYLGEHDTKIVLAVGSAGSGKTLFACYTAIQDLRKGLFQKIIITRPVVPVEEEEIGFLPGSLNSKMDPWTRPIFDVFLEFYSQRDIDIMLHSGVIEISPLAFMRGRTFKRTFIIADEMQNSSPNQMLMLTTRLGVDSKMVITGDLKQSDRSMDNGLSDLLNKWKKYIHSQSSSGGMNGDNVEENRGIKYVELGVNDVMRSPIVSLLLDVYENTKEFVNTNVKNNSIAHFHGKTIENTTSFSQNKLELNEKLNENLNESIPIRFHSISGVLLDDSPKVVDKVVDNTKKNETTKIVRYGENDAALIPINHHSKYFNKK
jgi:phosphate starvation-inducible PhoH-like protein